MNQKQVGITVIIFSILLIVLFLFHYWNNMQNIAEFMRLSSGTCFNEAGECLHAKPDYVAFGGFALSFLLLGMGLYLFFFDKTHQMIMHQHKEATTVLKKAEEMKETNEKRDKLHAFLEGFDEKKKSILKAVYDQDGIQQSTLRFRTGLSKTELSLLLKDLEEKQIISREDAGKTKKVYWRKVL